MKVGLIARADERGLGRQTHELYRHLHPDRTLAVDMGDLARGFRQQFARYPDATIAPFDGHRFDEQQVKAWLDGLDVVYTAETGYDARIHDWAREVGCRTVVHVNPEFNKWASDPGLPRPDAFWAPTPWRLKHLPKGTRVVPVPVADDLLADRPRDHARTFLHIAGKRAMGDRNGTAIVAKAASFTTHPSDLIVTCQEKSLPLARGYSGRTRIRTILGGIPHYPDLYRLGDVLVMPRRYGGLCLPVQEAMATGMPVVMTACPPQDRCWPILGVFARSGRSVNTPGGRIRCWDTEPRALAHALDDLIQHPELVASMSEAALAWAREHTWSALTPLYRDELARVAGL